jgi:hypothetical protein
VEEARVGKREGMQGLTTEAVKRDPVERRREQEKGE